MMRVMKDGRGRKRGMVDQPTVPSFTIDPFLVFGEIGSGAVAEDDLLGGTGAGEVLELTAMAFRTFFVACVGNEMSVLKL